MYDVNPPCSWLHPRKNYTWARVNHGFTLITGSPRVYHGFTTGSQRLYHGSTMRLSRVHNALITEARRVYHGFTTYPSRKHDAFITGSQRIHHGLPLIYNWFPKVHHGLKLITHTLQDFSKFAPRVHYGYISGLLYFTTGSLRAYYTLSWVYITGITQVYCTLPRVH